MGRLPVPRKPVLPRPEDADSWGEFNARYEQEMDGRRTWLPPRTLAIIGFFYTVGVLVLGYGHWWLGPCLVVTAALVVQLGRAVVREDQMRARDGDLSRLRDDWFNHLHQGPAPW